MKEEIIVAPTIFESFNARFLSSEEVAQTFIPSLHFETLATRNHSVIVGPRGSGKTSLLKMLQTTALETWNHPKAEEYRRRIDYSSVFVGTDKAWRESLESLANVSMDPRTQQRMCTAAFTNHVIHSLVNAFNNRLSQNHPGGSRPLHRRVTLSEKNEQYLVTCLSDHIKINPTLRTLFSLKHAISGRYQDLWLKSQQIKNKKLQVDDIEYVDLHFLKVCSYAIEIFNDVAKREQDRWALLFDELELAPNFILQEILTSIRSVDEKLLIKISMYPFNSHIAEFRDSIKAQPGHDYSEICLWYSHKEKAYGFSRELVQALLRREGIKFQKLSRIFGKSIFEEDRRNAYGVHSVQYEAFKEALDKDLSFRKFFGTQRLSMNDLTNMKDEEKGKVIRKSYPVLLLRNYFRKLNREGNSTGRSRKNLYLYGGERAILAMTEGNPRWIIGLMKEYMPVIRSMNGQISPEIQISEIMKIINRFRAQLKVTPALYSSGTGNPRSLLNMIDRIGSFFYESVVKGDFRLDAYGSFTVDSKVDRFVEKDLGTALNAGAIVFVPDEEGALMLTSMKGKRFRLSYMLSPYYKIPIRLGEPLALSRMLGENSLEGRQEAFDYAK